MSSELANNSYYYGEKDSVPYYRNPGESRNSLVSDRSSDTRYSNLPKYSKPPPTLSYNSGNSANKHSGQSRNSLRLDRSSEAQYNNVLKYSNPPPLPTLSYNTENSANKSSSRSQNNLGSERSSDAQYVNVHALKFSKPPPLPTLSYNTGNTANKNSGQLRNSLGSDRSSDTQCNKYSKPPPLLTLGYNNGISANKNSGESQNNLGSDRSSDTQYNNLLKYSKPPPHPTLNYNTGNSANHSYHSKKVNYFNHSPPESNYVRYLHPNPFSTRGYYRNVATSRYPNSHNQYMGHPGPLFGWQQTYYKRTRLESGDSESPKTSKKKKKPLSQNVPNKKDWTTEDAQLALSTEKEFNKKSKNSLIIKFPDHDLSKEIVSQFHSSIENVHFQQPCTPRFCFVTLQESADPEEIINALNKKKFGEGYLTVEYKKDRDEDQVVLVDDIDPLTLYVGNLAQEVTKEDIVNLYPKNKRIDIGFAKKMKFTRYAFIAFRNAADSLEAFKRTHCKQMYSKSLIVRFRRLHGTIGMPGAAKPQNPPKTTEEPSSVSSSSSIPVNECAEKSEEQQDEDNFSFFDDDESQTLALNVDFVKQERASPDIDDLDYDDNIAFDSSINKKKSTYDEIIVGESRWTHTPILKTEPNVNIKTERDITDKQIKSEEKETCVTVKPEPQDSDQELHLLNLHQDDEEMGDNDDEDDAFSEMMDFDRIYENMLLHKEKLSSLRKT